MGWSPGASGLGLVVGGSFSPSDVIRSEYAVLLHGAYESTLGAYFGSWEALQGLLEKFIWSQRVFGWRAKIFWEQCCTV